MHDSKRGSQIIAISVGLYAFAASLHRPADIRLRLERLDQPEQLIGARGTENLACQRLEFALQPRLLNAEIGFGLAGIVLGLDRAATLAPQPDPVRVIGRMSASCTSIFSRACAIDGSPQPPRR